MSETKIALTSGFLARPTDSAPRWFNVYVFANDIHIAILNEQTYSYRGPEFLLNDARKRGFILPVEANEAIHRFMDSGARVLSAMQKSIKADMRGASESLHRNSEWITAPEHCIWRLVQQHVPDDIQDAVYAMLKCFRFHITDDGKIEIQRME